MSGPPREPTERKRRKGNPGRRPLPEPVAYLPPATNIPEPPASLRRHGKALWVQIWNFGRPWLSPDSDVVSVKLLCEATDEREKLKQAIETVGYMVDGRDGFPVVNPSVNQLRKLNVEIMRLLSALGLTPTDRARMGLVEVKRSALKDFLGDKS